MAGDLFDPGRAKLSQISKSVPGVSFDPLKGQNSRKIFELVCFRFLEVEGPPFGAGLSLRPFRGVISGIAFDLALGRDSVALRAACGKTRMRVKMLRVARSWVRVWSATLVVLFPLGFSFFGVVADQYPFPGRATGTHKLYYTKVSGLSFFIRIPTYDVRDSRFQDS